mmetsp:Transcript_12689/g.26872  ORF Transcript_12689/g.26872 Transcript_12689/m.26872 type:complete len:208 (-) Transcript_12689:404-1027(-)
MSTASSSFPVVLAAAASSSLSSLSSSFCSSSSSATATATPAPAAAPPATPAAAAAAAALSSTGSSAASCASTSFSSSCTSSSSFWQHLQQACLLQSFSLGKGAAKLCTMAIKYSAMATILHMLDVESSHSKPEPEPEHTPSPVVMNVKPCVMQAMRNIMPSPYCNPVTAQHISMKKVRISTMAATAPAVRATTPINCATRKKVEKLS